MEGLVAIFGIAIIIGVVLLIRWLGAWMLRIDEVINIQNEILKELKKRKLMLKTHFKRQKKTLKYRNNTDLKFKNPNYLQIKQLGFIFTLKSDHGGI